MQPLDPAKIREITENMLGMGSSGGPPSLLQTPSAPPDLEQVWQVLAVHEESIREFGSVIFKMGVALDTARLSIQMLCNIIMEKEIVSKEELSERYDRDVVKKLQAMQLDAKRQMEEMMAAVKAEAEKAKAGPAELLEKDITPEHLSDVVLPSERGGGIVTFPSRKPVEDENR